MKLQHTPTLAIDLQDNYLILDTTTLINASKSDEFLELLLDITERGCIFATLPSVAYEFTRGSSDLEEYSQQSEFLKQLKVTVLNGVEERIDANTRAFIVAYNKAFNKRSSHRAPSYTDSLLCAIAYKYRHKNMKITTANHKDIPLNIFNRSELITVDVGGELRTEAIYKFSENKLSKMLTKLESQLDRELNEWDITVGDGIDDLD